MVVVGFVVVPDADLAILVGGEDHSVVEVDGLGGTRRRALCI